jgi:serine/threonine-protein kinase
MSTTAAPSVSIPARIGRYRIDGVLGEGAMGVVYRGYDPELARRVAVKTLKKERLGGENGGELLARFKREAEAGIRLSHKHVVTVYEFGEDENMAFMAMEFIDGRSLKDLNAARAPWPLLEALDLAGQLLEALDFFHERGVVHRDIKPANIMVDAAGTLTVTDFGIARTQSSDLTQVGTVLGTPSYMSPEQITGQPIDGRSDLFSVGVVLYEMLTGAKPFRGEMITIAHNIVSQPHPDPSTLKHGLPPAIDTLFRHALAKKPADRFASGAEFRAALQAMLAEILAGGLPAPGAGADARHAAASPAPPPTPLVVEKSAPAPLPAATDSQRRTFDRCPKCDLRFPAPRPWNAVCPGCGTALFEAARSGKGSTATPTRTTQGRQGAPWLVLLGALIAFVTLLLVLKLLR